MLPFTADEFFAVFAEYNRAIWPLQVVAYGLGVVAVGMGMMGGKRAGRWISLILGLFWIGIGAGYHLMFFAEINPLARVFGAAFILQGLLFLWEGVKEGSLEFKFAPDKFGLTGLLFIVYGMVAYPLLSIWTGHAYPELPGFGVVPCPTTIFTFGMLLWGARRVPEHLLILPILWSILGTTAVFLGAVQDLGLIAAGLTSAVMIRWHNRVVMRRL